MNMSYFKNTGQSTKKKSYTKCSGNKGQGQMNFHENVTINKKQFEHPEQKH